MKALITWTGVVVFLALAMTAVKQGEWVIALVMGGISFVFLIAAPGGDKPKTKRGKKGRAGSVTPQ